MNKRCEIAFRNPLARADMSVEEFYARICVENRWLSTIVTINK